ncbi:MAG: biopolymer transporter ExbD [Pedobacter agri]|jgi:biopolymer transport protein ExbD|uniref:Biopolymer transporter ExbD n=1 Tax=Pedobacter agri TaxID=454586 RepID=A0A9X3DBC2_9SPHI|nr:MULTISPECIES: biopolymer transporter ExbD [Pedobacter]AZI25069.1 biopolymer transporter ExbD [Pedobacter sp. G11]MCX3264174.1 biopolymer transporter ExbD [Pedobacter agri]MDQ1141026.1 biopolymer transport protein ExbD [Pedobacter agri]
MAELNTGGKKATPRVDMTPMVDLMFLLVTFFILTTSISTPQAMDIVKPDKDDNNKDNRLELKASKTMTILLGKNDKVAWYMGEAGATAPTYENLSQVEKSIIENRKVADASGVKGEFVVLVKPTSGSNFKNFVDIMDELEILKVKVRQIDDDNILDSEKESMKSQGIL